MTLSDTDLEDAPARTCGPAPTTSPRRRPTWRSGPGSATAAQRRSQVALAAGRASPPPCCSSACPWSRPRWPRSAAARTAPPRRTDFAPCPRRVSTRCPPAASWPTTRSGWPPSTALESGPRDPELPAAGRGAGSRRWTAGGSPSPATSPADGSPSSRLGDAGACQAWFTGPRGRSPDEMALAPSPRRPARRRRAGPASTRPTQRRHGHPRRRGPTGRPASTSGAGPRGGGLGELRTDRHRRRRRRTASPSVGGRDMPQPFWRLGGDCARTDAPAAPTGGRTIEDSVPPPRRRPELAVPRRRHRSPRRSARAAATARTGLCPGRGGRPPARSAEVRAHRRAGAAHAARRGPAGGAGRPVRGALRDDPSLRRDRAPGWSPTPPEHCE